VWRGGGGDLVTAQAEKQPAVAPADMLATLAARFGEWRRTPPSEGSANDPFTKDSGHVLPGLLGNDKSMIDRDHQGTINEDDWHSLVGLSGLSPTSPQWLTNS
jgi:hypothetical protein